MPSGWEAAVRPERLSRPLSLRLAPTVPPPEMVPVMAPAPTSAPPSSCAISSRAANVAFCLGGRLGAANAPGTPPADWVLNARGGAAVAAALRARAGAAELGVETRSDLDDAWDSKSERAWEAAMSSLQLCRTPSALPCVSDSRVALSNARRYSASPLDCSEYEASMARAICSCSS